MNDKDKLALLGLIVAGVLAAVFIFILGGNIAVLNPKGTISSQERHLIVEATLLMLIVVIPVYLLTFAIAWRYREGNKQAKYDPDLDHHQATEILWWVIPGAIITVLSVITWHSAHALDPFRSLSSSVKPINIQVIALDWKWLFIYPQQEIAAVNLVEFPVNTPVNFKITSDAPMNSFWVPQLSGQIYCMAGMITQLHLDAAAVGSYYGSSANISGRGFAGMKFTAKAVNGPDFNQWIKSVKRTPHTLSQAAYDRLARPSENNPVAYYSSVENNIFINNVVKFLRPENITAAAAVSKGGGY